MCHLTLVVGSRVEAAETVPVSPERPAGGAVKAEGVVGPEGLAGSEGIVAAEVAAVLAGSTDEHLAAAPLALPLALSVCMQRHGAGTDGLVAAMKSLRRAVLAVSGLDPRTEPVPLLAGDPRTAALGFAEYLRGLIGRAARACAAAPDDVASAAASRLA